MSTPQYIKEGWRPAGPGLCRCPHCRAIVTTNALGRARHVCPEPAPEKPAEDRQ